MLVYFQSIETPADRERFEAVYLAYRGLMFHVANAILKNEQDAEDAVHQSFVKLAERMERVPEGPCPRTRALVATVAERTAIDLYRARRRHPWVELDERSLTGGPPPEEGGLAAAMAALPPRYREVLLLKYYNGYESEEIAAFLSTTPENVRQLLFRGRRKLAAALEEGGERA